MIKLKLRIIGQQLHIETGLQTISMPEKCRFEINTRALTMRDAGESEAVQKKISSTQRDADLKGLSEDRRKGFSLRDVGKRSDGFRNKNKNYA